MLAATVMAAFALTGCGSSDCELDAKVYADLNERYYYAEREARAVEDALKRAGVPMSNPAWNEVWKAPDNLGSQMMEIFRDSTAKGCNFDQELANLDG